VCANLFQKNLCYPLYFYKAAIYKRMNGRDRVTAEGTGRMDLTITGINRAYSVPKKPLSVPESYNMYFFWYDD
jgi:hypothetical protein